jgi:hypothetical protein
MNRKILESCPTCGGEFAVSELTCTVCDTVVRSRYSPCPFCRLAPEDLAFMLLFVRHRGNVKDMERELGVSYWTIRGRLNEVIASMGLEPAGGEGPDDRQGGAEAPDYERGRQAARQDTLDRLKRGEITAEEAAEELRIRN